MLGAGEPVAPTVNVTVLPPNADWLTGCCVMVGATALPVAPTEITTLELFVSA
jgi:hypothetical protein